MSKWYYSVDGRAEGPVGDDVIIENLKAGKLTLVDLVFREGDDRWHTLGDIPVFKDSFAKVSLPPNPTAEPAVAGRVGTVTNFPASAASAPQVSGGPFKFESSPTLTWVLLTKKVTGKDEQFLQSGPFSAEQIEKMLSRGECKYSDYVWRPGYHRWARLGNLPEFDRRRKSRDGDRTPEVIPLPKIEIEARSTAKELENVVRARVAQTSGYGRKESPPAEADGNDLAEITATNFDISPLHKPSVPEPPAAFMPPVTTGSKPLESSGPPPRVPEPPAGLKPITNEEDLKTVVYGGNRPPPTGAYPPPISKSYDPDRTMIQPSQSSQSVPSDDDMELEEMPGPAWMRFRKPAIAAAIVVLVLVAGFQLLDMNIQFGSSDKAVENTEPIAEAPPQEPVAPKPPVAVKKEPFEPAPKAVPAPTVAPQPKSVAVVEPESPSAPALGVKPIAPGTGRATVLEIVAIRTDTIKPQFAINTNAPLGSSIYFLISARSGDILRFPSFQATSTIVRSGGEVPTVDLSNLKLPPGEYRLEAAVGDLRRSKNVFIGTKNAFFEEELERHLKQVSFQQQNEKKAIYHSARLMEDLARDLGETYAQARTDARKWRGFYLDWQKNLRQAEKVLVGRVIPERRNEMAYPDEIIALKQAALKLKDQAEDLNESVLAGAQARDVAGSGNLAIVKEFSRLKTQAANISSRR